MSHAELRRTETLKVLKNKAIERIVQRLYEYKN